MADDISFGNAPPDQRAHRDAMNATLARNWWAIILRGAIGVLFGIVALTTPGAVLLSLAFVFGIYLVIDGAIGLIATLRAVRVHRQWHALLAEAVLNIIIGLIAMLMPAAAVLAFVLMMAVWALISGGLMIAAAIRLHLSHGRWWLLLGGIASLIWGMFLVAAPLAGAVVLTWWLGIYLIVFGSALLVCGWKLRAQHLPPVS